VIIGEIIHNDHYQDVYDDLLKLISSYFVNVESGFQGDAYIWITEKDEQVSLDTFTSMQFQIKTNQQNNLLVARVIDVLGKVYKIDLYDPSEMKSHEQ
jgi:hypothetical protein